jgi:hypothetical protein
MNQTAIKEYTPVDMEELAIHVETLNIELSESVEQLRNSTYELQESVKGLQNAVHDMCTTLDRIHDNTNKRFDKVDSKLDKIVKFFGGGKNV